MTSSAAPGETAPQLDRQLGLATAIAAVAGECIGVGIFLTPAGMAKSLGSPFWLLVVWLATGLMTLCGALCYGELAARFTRPGGTYVYLYEAFGPRLAFLYGWMSLLVLDPGLTAALATGLSAYVAFIFPLSSLQKRLIAVVVLASLCVVNIIGTKLSGRVLRWSTWLKLAILFFVVVFPFGMRLGSFSNFSPFVAQRPASLPLFAGLAAAMVSAAFSFGGWWDVSKIAGEVRDPHINLPRAMIFGVLLVAGAYVLVSFAFLYLVPIQNVTSDETFVAQAGSILFGRGGAVFFSSVVILCVLSSLAAMVMAAPRVYFAMAKDGLFFPSVGEAHPRFGTPYRAIGIQGAVASVLILVGTFQQIIAYFIFPAVLFLGLSVAGLFIVRRRAPHGSPYDTPGFPFVACVFLGMVSVLLVLLAGHSPRQVAMGMAVVLSGLPIYTLLFHRRDSLR